MPQVSVIMPVYNGEIYLREAIESILTQSFKDFEFIIVDDGSTDGTPALLREYQRRDARIRIQRQDVNGGIVSALNLGISMAQGEYIARMDADDASLPHRLAYQVGYLERHPEIGILGSNICCVDESGKSLYAVRYPETPAEVRWLGLLFSPFAHPAVMWRVGVFRDNQLSYRPEMVRIEDYDLWARALARTYGANLQNNLLRYRIHPQSITSNYAAPEQQKHIEISQHVLDSEFPCHGYPAGELVRALSGNRQWEEFDRRAELADQYLDLWLSFRAKYSTLPGLGAAESDVIRITFEMAIHPRGQTHSRQTLKQLHQLDVHWRLLFIQMLLEKILAKTINLFHLPFPQTRPVI